MKTAKKIVSNYGGTVIVVVMLFMLYVLATDKMGWLDSTLFPGVGKIGEKMSDQMPKLWQCFLSSMKLLIPGYFSAALFGIVLGVIIGLNRTLHKIVKPLVFALNPIPPSMLTPYLIALLPTFYLSSVAVIFIGCFWPFLTGTINGILLINQKYIDNAKVLQLKGVKNLFCLILPAASPMILGGAGTALNFSFILLTVAEMFATNSGLGYYIQYYADFSDYARVIGGLLFTMMIIIAIMTLFDRLKKKILFWTLNEQKF